jgi:hypothetical protein
MRWPGWSVADDAEGKFLLDREELSPLASQNVCEHLYVERCRAKAKQAYANCIGLEVRAFLQLTECALSRAIRRSNGLHQRPVSVFLAIFMDAKLSQEHAGNLSRLQNANKGVGFHYIYFQSTRR